jgi:tRNA 2-thiouridine synthesizing protein D
MADRTLTIAIMDAPYEAAASTTAFRIIASALGRGVDVNVFAYEGAVSLTMKDQAPHANPVKGTSVEEEDHPTTKDLVAALVELGRSEPRLSWVNCGLCVDERGAGPATGSTA